MQFLRNKNFVFLYITVFISLLLLSFVTFYKYQGLIHLISKGSSKDYIYEKISTTDSAIHLNSAQLKKTPTIVKAVYVTGWSADTKSYISYLQSLFETTQINAVVIDVKDSSGIISYHTGAEMAKKEYMENMSPHKMIPNIDELLQELHKQGIYAIGKIVVFEDPVLAKNRPELAVYDKVKTRDVLTPVLWKDNKGLFWVDPASEEVWDYNIAIAKDALMHGFDEINFDYVRFPADDQNNNMGFPVFDQKTSKNFVIKSFFLKLRESFPKEKISINIFGQTTTNTDDMGIGQVFEDSLGYFDYVCPMIYPSNYADGFMGYSNPAEHPYEITKHAMDSALTRQNVYEKVNNKSKNKMIGFSQSKPTKIRPWLQDFNPGAVYDSNMVAQEIKAVTDSAGKDFSGFMLWNPLKTYTKEAFLIAESNK